MTKSLPSKLSILIALLLLIGSQWRQPTTQASTNNGDVYILSSGDATIDQAVADAVTARNYTPIIGVEWSSWNGSQYDLDYIDVVIFLNSVNWNGTDMPSSGQIALEDFVYNGGGLITTPWVHYNTNFGDLQTLSALLPVTYAGYSSTDSTTYTEAVSEPTINANLPTSFNFTLHTYSGAEEQLQAKTGATTFYTSSNTGTAGLVGWGYGVGRVAALSSMPADTTLSDSNYATLFGNVVDWVAILVGSGNCHVPNDYATVGLALIALCDVIDVASGSHAVNDVITRDVVIRGEGEEVTFLDVANGGNRRAFHNWTGNHLTVQDLTVRGGNATNSAIHGLGIYNDDGAHLTLERVTLSDNDTAGHGGSIYSAGTGIVEMTDSTIELSDANHGGGIYISGFGVLSMTQSTIHTNTATYGGGIYLDSYDGSCGGYARVTIDGSTIRDNTATGQYGGYGGGIYGDGTNCGRGASQTADVNITNSQFSNNSADEGGAIRIRFHTALDNVSFVGNTAHEGGAIKLFGDWDGGGALDITNSVFQGNQATDDPASSYWFGDGGAIYAEDGVITVDGTVFAGNSAETQGGAIYNTGSTLTINTSTLNDNTATGGGGLYLFGADTTITQTLLTNNIANGNSGGNDDGGGVRTLEGTTTLEGVTLTGNWAYSNGGGVSQQGSGSTTIRNSTLYGNWSPGGGGVHNFGSTMNIAHTTFFYNHATGVGGGGIRVFNGGVTTIAHTIIADSQSGDDCRPNSDGSQLISLGYNIDSDGTCGLDVALGDQPSTDPLLSGYGYWQGGSTPTFLPLDGSPALDRGSADSAICTGIDQTSTPRLQGLFYNGAFVPTAGCDIGAVEVNTTTLTTYLDPFDRFHQHMNDTFVQTAIAYRTTEITDPANDQFVTLDDILQTFRSFNNGWYFYRYCADFENIAAGQACVDFDTLPAQDQTERGGDFDAPSTTRDLYNGLLEALAAFQWIDANYPAARPDYLVEIDTAVEMGHIPLVFGNEFMVDALRYSFGPAQQFGAVTGAEMIQDEIDQLEEARQQFALVSDMLVWLVEQELGDGVVTDYFDETDFETFAIASEREIEASIEIIERKRLLGVDPTLLLAEIETAYVRQYVQSTLLAQAIEQADISADSNHAQQLYLDNGGWQLMNNLDTLTHLADSIRAGSNLLGYDPLYVPRSSFETLRDRMGTLGTCDTATGLVTGGSGELLALLNKECAAGAADRSFDQNAQDLAQELSDLEQAFGDELFELCGLDVNDANADLTTCTGGEMGINYSELEVAQQAVGLAWQRAQNIPDLIAIEEERAGTIINVIFTTGEQISALEIANGVLRAYREVTTSAQTTEVWANGSDPNDPESAAYWLDFGKDTLNCLLSGATLGALGDGCAGNNDNLFGAIADLAGIEDQPTRIETVETISDPNELEIAGNVGMVAIREAQRDATIVGANSNAEIKRLLLEQADLLIEYEIAVAELNRVITERNLLIQRHRYALNEHTRLVANTADNYIDTPALRLIRDQTALNAELTRDRVIHTTYLTIKALEYTLLAEPMSNNVCGISGSLLDALYQARTASHLNDILCELDTITLPIDDYPGNQYIVNISVAEDLWGLSDDNLNELLPFTPDINSPTWPSDLPDCGPFPITISDMETLRYCFFQERLRAVVIANADVRVLANNDNLPAAGESIYFNFNTQLEDVVELGDFGRWNIRIADSDDCAGCGVAVNIAVREAYTGRPVSVYLTHQGQAMYRQANGDVVAYNPGLTALLGQAIPAGWPAGNVVNAAITASVDGNGGLTNGTDLSNLSAATSDWRFRLDLSGSGQDLVLANIDDFEITIDTIALTVNRVRLEELEAEAAKLQAEGEEVPVGISAEISRLQTLIANEAEQAPDPTPLAPNLRFSDDIIGGTYSGNVFIEQPIPLGLFDMGVTITRTGSTLSGHLCGACGPLIESAEITGVFTQTGTMTHTFALQSEPFVQTIGEHVVTRTIWLQGIVFEDGNVMRGTYVETIEGYGSQVLSLEGDWIGNRPIKITDPDTVPTAISIDTIAIKPTAIAPLFLLIGTLILSTGVTFTRAPGQRMRQDYMDA